MTLPHESFFFLTGGTGPRPTHAAFLAAATKRTAKTEARRERETSKEKMREQQMQREKSLEFDGVGVGVIRLLGLRGVREKGARKYRGNEGKHGDTGGMASCGHAENKTSGAELVKDVSNAQESGKDAVEDSIVQSAGYNGGARPTGGVDVDADTHPGAKHTHCNDTSDESHIQLCIDKNSDTQEKGVGMLLDTGPVLAATPRLPDGDELDGEKGITAEGRESIVSKRAQNSASRRGQSIHESMNSHVPNTPPVLPGLEIYSDINPDDIRPPIIVPAPNPDDGVEKAPFKNTPPGLESDSILVVPYPHDTRDPFSPTPHLPPPWERLDGMFGATQTD